MLLRNPAAARALITQQLSNISATRKSYGMILVSFDCYEIQLSNDNYQDWLCIS
jgi:hypothetical protein